jgi:hypothetical protein
MKTTIDQIVMAHLDLTSALAMARASVRYEALRRLTPIQFTALHKSALMGTRFDDLVDALVVDMKTNKMLSLGNEQPHRELNGAPRQALNGDKPHE